MNPFSIEKTLFNSNFSFKQLNIWPSLIANSTYKSIKVEYFNLSLRIHFFRNVQQILTFIETGQRMDVLLKKIIMDFV